MKDSYCPDVGDLIWLTVDPQTGHEPAGRGPALVLSPQAYNRKSGLALICPLTTQAKGYPFEVVVPSGCGTTGVVLADHVKSADWQARRSQRLGRAPTEVVDEVLARLAPLLGY